MNINWYPGHMKKTRESIEAKLKNVDIVMELLDARVPISSKNPILDDILKDKTRLVILTKADLADIQKNDYWRNYFKKQYEYSLVIDANESRDIEKIYKIANEIKEDIFAGDEEKGIKNRPLRAMIVGIPNVGKSTLINGLSGRKGAKVGNRPGVTKSNQWIKTTGGLDLLDTPGILWPKFEDQNVAMNLAFIGSIKDEIMDIETLALRLIERLIILYPEELMLRYKLDDISNSTGLDVMEEIGRKRGCIISRGEIDYTRVASLVLDEFRKGQIGRITLDEYLGGE